MKMKPLTLTTTVLVLSQWFWSGAAVARKSNYLRTPTRIFPKKVDADNNYDDQNDAQSEETSEVRPLNQLAKQKRIIGGHESVQGRYSYAVSLKDEATGHFCGGSLIARDVVLTASHCAGGNYTVIIGRHALDSNDGEEIEIGTEVPHPDWNPATTEYDFNLIFLSETAPSNVDLVMLNTNSNIPNAGESATVMGWGVSSLAQGTMSNTLRDVEVKAMSNEECAQSEGWVGNLYDSYQGAIKDNMLCAQDSGEDSCQGDSGGGLVLEGSDGSSDLLVGVVSWGIGCASDTFPGVYARVSSAFDWIKAEVCNRSSDPPSYFDCESPQAASANMNNLLSKLAVPPTTSPTNIKPTASDSCEHYFSLDIHTDGYASEISWELEAVKGERGKMIGSGPPADFAYEDNTYYQSTAHGCLAPGTYRFIMHDTYGDGIIQPGYYQITLNGQVLALNSNFGYEESTSFTIGSLEPVKYSSAAFEENEWIDILEENFVHGYGHFNAGGRDAFHYTTVLNKLGVVRIQGGDGMKSSIYSDKIPLGGTNYETIKVTFSFLGYSMEPDDKFCLDIMINDSPAWVEQMCWHGHSDFDNDIWYDDYPFEMQTSSTMDSIRIRFRCDANSVHDDVLIDSVKIQGMM